MPSLRSYIELARPFTLLAPFVGFWAGGFAAFGAEGLPLEWRRLLPLAFGALMAAALNVASNAVNQIFDLEADAVNKSSRPIPSGRVSITEAWGVTVVFYVLSLALAWLATPPEGQGFAGRECFWIVCLTVFLTYAYSGPPFRTKRWGLLANFTISIPRGMLLPVAGWAAVATVRQPEPWVLASAFWLFILGAATTKDFSDMAGDAKQGVRTLPIVYGIRAAAWMTAPFLVFPFLVWPAGVALGYLHANAAALAGLGVLLALYGCYTSYLILRRPEELATEANHVSWKHMYLQMMAAQIGMAVCYHL
jgi:4-hydroxybenzoate polyprenyltransferase